ncbi:tyrosine-type recombinase/integrase [Pseudoalteromonas luteoviolacea]|uniref:tyrosine-type recombinase/integrase n=1 Tax=Pseudoalteromonas luteoviolacea TaxID=43657 RepID=UPI001B38B1A5|nr:tyrosine-type recombinase/integrase [Pseudoalteromonas luteoviolacea]MBQ4811362.1 tyrosine-type recombinase/integrase [Pseudoalteromonas luteoviolacea]
MVVREACRHFLLHCQYVRKLSPHTLRAYERDLDTFVTLVDEKSVLNIDKHHLKLYLFNLHQTDLGIRSIKRRVACLKSMFRWLEQEEIITSNPMLKVDTTLKVPNQLPRNIPKKNLRKMLKTAREELGLTKGQGYELQSVGALINSAKDLNKLTCVLSLELLFATGVRVSELVSIEMNHIMLKERKVKVLGKGQRERFVFLPSIEILTLLNTYTSVRSKLEIESIFLLVNSRGNQASPHFVRKLLRETAEKASIDRITPHMYRHSSACQLLESGVDIRYVQKLLGHQSILTTQLYTHVNDNELQKKITKANIRSFIA